MMPSTRTFVLTDTPRVVPLLETRAAGDELLVSDPATGCVHVLNATAALVLMRLDGKTALDAIVADLTAATGVERARIERDIVAVCDAFREKQLID